MRLKSFSAPTIAEALDQIRRELGVDAVIVSTQHDGPQVQVTAALETESPAAVPLAQSLLEAPPQKVYSALQIMKVLCRCIDYHVIPPALADRFLERARLYVQTKADHTFEEVLDALIPQSPLAFDKTSFFLLEGPPGAGKSITAAKLASECVLAGLQPIVITLDTLKAGAVEQLLTYTKALKATFQPFQTSFEVVNYLRERDPHRPVIIDTPGLNPRHPTEAKTIQELSQILGISTTLVYPAGMDSYELLDRTQHATDTALSTPSPQKVILTRCDTVSRLGTLLTIASDAHLSLSHLGMGPELGNRLRPLNSALLFRLLVAPFKKQSSQEMSSSHPIQEIAQ